MEGKTEGGEAQSELHHQGVTAPGSDVIFWGPHARPRTKQLKMTQLGDERGSCFSSGLCPTGCHRSCYLLSISIILCMCQMADRASASILCGRKAWLKKKGCHFICVQLLSIAIAGKKVNPRGCEVGPTCFQYTFLSVALFKVPKPWCPSSS